MASPTGFRQRPPLDNKRLEELALRYVGRFATTRAKLRAYLSRKVRERGWAEPREPDLAAIANRFCALGYVDDAAYGLAKSQALTSRGYGKRRVRQKLQLAGISEEDGMAAHDHADAQAVESALRFAERRRIGPFAAAVADPKQRQRAIAAMIRAGHSFALARTIADLAPGSAFSEDELRERARADPS